MDWIIIIGVFIAIMLYFLYKKKEIGYDTTMNKGILEEQSVPAAMDFTKQDESLSSSAVTQTITTKIRGVSYKNPDGTDRQKIIKKCKKGEEVHLVREPDNPHDAACIAVFQMTGEQIGYIGKNIAFRHPAFKDLTYYMDIGAKVSAKILRIMGEEHQNYGCVTPS